MAVIIPKALKKSPLISVAFELRFDGVEPYNDLFATKIAYAISRGNINQMKRLPISQVPEFARLNDMAFEPVLGFKYYETDILVGPKVVIVRTPQYKGWSEFSKIILDVVDCVNLFVARVVRVGFRSIDFFEGERIDDRLNLAVSTSTGGISESLKRMSCSFAITYVDGANRVRLNYANDATVFDNKKSAKKGSVVDVDAFCENPVGGVAETISAIHDLGKKVFFESLKEDFVKTMEPEYE